MEEGGRTGKNIGSMEGLQHKEKTTAHPIDLIAMAVPIRLSGHSFPAANTLEPGYGLAVSDLRNESIAPQTPANYGVETVITGKRRENENNAQKNTHKKLNSTQR